MAAWRLVTCLQSFFNPLLRLLPPLPGHRLHQDAQLLDVVVITVAAGSNI
jgi:hypothetical protein